VPFVTPSTETITLVVVIVNLKRRMVALGTMPVSSVVSTPPGTADGEIVARTDPAM